jgi:hypothetical protein
VASPSPVPICEQNHQAACEDRRERVFAGNLATGQGSIDHHDRCREGKNDDDRHHDADQKG